MTTRTVAGPDAPIGKRIGARLVQGVIATPFVGMFYYGEINYSSGMKTFGLIAIFALTAVNIYLMFKEGTPLGGKIMGLTYVDSQTGEVLTGKLLLKFLVSAVIEGVLCGLGSLTFLIGYRDGQHWFDRLFTVKAVMGTPVEGPGGAQTDQFAPAAGTAESRPGVTEVQAPPAQTPPAQAGATPGAMVPPPPPPPPPPAEQAGDNPFAPGGQAAPETPTPSVTPVNVPPPPPPPPPPAPADVDPPAPGTPAPVDTNPFAPQGQPPLPPAVPAAAPAPVEPPPAPAPLPEQGMGLDDATVLDPELSGVGAPTVPVVAVDGDGTRIELHTPVVLGRNPAAPAQYPNAKPVLLVDQSMRLSKTHAVLVPLGEGGIGIFDVGSTNGVHVEVDGEKQRLPAGELHPWPEGATLHVGGCSLRLES